MPTGSPRLLHHAQGPEDIRVEVSADVLQRAFENTAEGCGPAIVYYDVAVSRASDCVHEIGDTRDVELDWNDTGVTELRDGGGIPRARIDLPDVSGEQFADGCGADPTAGARNQDDLVRGLLSCPRLNGDFVQQEVFRVDARAKVISVGDITAVHPHVETGRLR